MKKVYIIRGLPGSGKSYAVSKLAGEDACICNADQFFMVDNEYRFDPTKLPVAHAECFKWFLDAIFKKYDKIIVDNTHIHRWEYQNYELAARIAGYQVEIMEFRPVTIDDVKLCIRRNTHRVPPDIIAKMAIEFEIDTRATVMPIIRG